jgi:hypothetical protein
MTKSLMGSITTLGWAIVIFAFALTFFALIMYYLIWEFYIHDTDMHFEYRQALWTYFGTFMRSLFTMFELTFANWPPVARLLIEDFHAIFIPLMILYRMLFGFAVVGVINSVFIQETFKVAAFDDNIMLRQRRKEKLEQFDKMQRLFNSADALQTGKLDAKQLADVFRDPLVNDWLAAMEFPVFTSVNEIKQLFDALDTDSDDYITSDDLVEGFARLSGSARSFDLIYLSREVQELRNLIMNLANGSAVNFHNYRDSAPSGSACGSAHSEELISAPDQQLSI